MNGTFAFIALRYLSSKGNTVELFYRNIVIKKIDIRNISKSKIIMDAIR